MQIHLKKNDMETHYQLEMQNQNHRRDITEAIFTLTMYLTIPCQTFIVILPQVESL